MTTLEFTDVDSLALTVALVAIDGHRMPLRGQERVAAVRAMVARGMAAKDIAVRLCTTEDVIALCARRNGISLARREPTVYAHRSKAPEYRREHRAKTRGAA